VNVGHTGSRHAPCDLPEMEIANATNLVVCYLETGGCCTCKSGRRIRPKMTLACKQLSFLVLGSSSCYAIFTSSPRRLCVVSSLFCSGCALSALSVQGLFWLVCAGSWHAGFGQVTIHGLRGMCFFFSPLPNTSFQWTAYGSR
jgi:hypothetical protein